jgi:hypothetical protein
MIHLMYAIRMALRVTLPTAQTRAELISAVFCRKVTNILTNTRQTIKANFSSPLMQTAFEVNISLLNIKNIQKNITIRHAFKYV